MAAKKRGLGDRGLGALLTGAKARVEQGAASEDGELRELPVDLVQRGVYQPRRDMDPEALEELAQSIRAQGVMQPIVVRPVADGRYEIIAGERRWRATQLAGLDTIPALVREVPDEAAIAMALIENIQRENLNPIEEATALKRLQDEFGLSQQQVAEAVGKSRTTITNLMRLMNLEPDTRTLLERGDLEMGHARALLGLKGREQVEAARQVVARGLSVRQTEALVRKLQQATPKQPAAKPDPDVMRLQNRLADTLGAKVRIDHGPRGKGKLVIEYGSLDELDGILAHIH